jgi:mono/diheme cytochrome c family protein
MEQIAALGAPAVVGGALVLLPFADRGNDRSPAQRKKFLAVVGAIVVGAGILTVVAKQSDAGDKDLQDRFAKQRADGEEARKLALLGVPPQGGPAVFDNDPQRIAKLFDRQCSGCHVDREGATDKEKEKRIGPLLGAGYGSRAWFKGFLTNPDDPRYYGKQPKIQALGDKRMKSVDHYEVSGDDLDAVVEWLYSQSGATDVKTDLAANGKKIVDDKCSDCHNVDGESADRGPNLGGKGSHEWLVDFVQRPDRLHFFGENNAMPVFRGKLSAADDEQLAEWLGSLAASK